MFVLEKISFTKVLVTVLVGALLVSCAPSKNSGLPWLKDIDQSPTHPSMRGKCEKVQEFAKNIPNSWCAINHLAPTNSFTPATDATMKVGRQTVFNGPILRQKLACNVDGIGSDRFATVAVSTKYFPTFESAWNEPKPKYCGQCMCISVQGGDKSKSHVQMDKVSKGAGLTFMGKVGDRCSECSDDSIDILGDRPYAFNRVTNEHEHNGYKVNAMDGFRGFDSPNGPYEVGTWTAIWNFVPCSWTHEQCANFVKNNLGYKNVFTPKWTKGRQNFGSVSAERKCKKWQKKTSLTQTPVYPTSPNPNQSPAPSADGNTGGSTPNPPSPPSDGANKGTIYPSPGDNSQTQQPNPPVTPANGTTPSGGQSGGGAVYPVDPQHGSIGTGNAPEGIPKLPNIDQDPTDPNTYGKCMAVSEDAKKIKGSWCELNTMKPNFEIKPEVNKYFKVGRQTIYSGPILAQKFACNVDGIGSDDFATVAVSSKYLPNTANAWNGMKPQYCGQCMCISVQGGDSAKSEKHNPNAKLNEEVINKHKGLSLMGKVGDRCGECNDDSIDILLDRPYSYNKIGEAEAHGKGFEVNAKSGLRGFDDGSTPYAVGTWVAFWNFVPCDWTHEQCAAYVKEKTGYDTHTPKMTPGKPNYSG